MRAYCPVSAESMAVDCQSDLRILLVSESSSCSYGASSTHPRRVIESSSSLGVKIEWSSSSVEVPLENSSVYLFIFERR